MFCRAFLFWTGTHYDLLIRGESVRALSIRISQPVAQTTFPSTDYDARLLDAKNVVNFVLTAAAAQTIHCRCGIQCFTSTEMREHLYAASLRGEREMHGTHRA